MSENIKVGQVDKTEWTVTTETLMGARSGQERIATGLADVKTFSWNRLIHGGVWPDGGWLCWKAPGSPCGQQADLEPAMGPAAERQTVSWACKGHDYSLHLTLLKLHLGILCLVLFSQFKKLENCRGSSGGLWKWLKSWRMQPIKKSWSSSFFSLEKRWWRGCLLVPVDSKAA